MKIKANELREREVKQGKKGYLVKQSVMHGDDSYTEYREDFIENIEFVYCLQTFLGSSFVEKYMDYGMDDNFSEFITENLLEESETNEESLVILEFWVKWFFNGIGIKDLTPEMLLDGSYKDLNGFEDFIDELREIHSEYSEQHDQSSPYSIDEIIYYNGTGKEFYLDYVTEE